jgi:hypothetical protein
MQDRKPWLPFLLIAVATGCKPAVSDVFVDVIDTSAVRQIYRNADTVMKEVPGNELAVMGILQGERLILGGGQKEITLWYNEHGKLAGTTERTHGKLADSVLFYPNGQRMFQFQFDEAGQPQGPARFFYADGRVWQDGRLTRGMKTGVWRTFHPDGRLLETHEYDQKGKKLR